MKLFVRSGIKEVTVLVLGVFFFSPYLALCYHGNSIKSLTLVTYALGTDLCTFRLATVWIYLIWTYPAHAMLRCAA